MNGRIAFEHALITGASRGLGRALALQLASLGARVSLVARGEAALSGVARQVRLAGGQALPIAADVGDPDSAQAIAARAVDAHGPIDLIVHAASTLGPVPLRTLVDTTASQLHDALAVNVEGPFRITRAILPSMLLAGRGTIVAISSDAAVEAYPTWGAYASSKAALDHLVRIWAQELEGTGVRAMAIDPGEMDTQMHAAAIPDADPASLARPDDVARWIVGALQRGPLAARWVAAPQEAAQ